MAGHIPWGQVDLPLRARRAIWLSTTRADGRPHAVPVWYLWDGRDLHFITPRASQKAKSLTRQPEVVLTSGDGDDAIILEGAAEIVVDPAERERLDRAYGDKYIDPGSGTRATIFNDGDELYRVRVHRIMVWIYGTIGNRTDWVFKDE